MIDTEKSVNSGLRRELTGSPRRHEPRIRKSTDLHQTMSINQQIYADDQSAPATPGVVRRFFKSFAVQDWMVVVYLTLLNLAVLSAARTPQWATSVKDVGSLWIAGVATLILVRGGLLKHQFFGPLVYRLGIFGSVQLSYFYLDDVLPLVNPGALDLQLYALDLKLFGFEPAVWMDQFVNSTTTEWFAFFYFSYFFILAIHVIPMIMFCKERRMLAEFALGMIGMVCVTHLLYMVVPGFGPYKALPHLFQNQLPSGMWMDMVNDTVAAGGAFKDIFPSLHTGAPTFLALFSFRYRDRMPFRYSWPLLAFFAINIIGATMFLRWHYVIDVVAGLSLAFTMAYTASRVAAWDERRRDRAGHGPVWPPFGTRVGSPQ